MNTQNRCIICDEKVNQLLKFNKQPLANNLLSLTNEEYLEYDLGLCYCPLCSHGQLSHFLNPSILFDIYLYASGTSNTLKNYFRSLAKSIKEKHGTKSFNLLEIASNDGSFLREIKNNDIDYLGIDPANNLKIKNDIDDLNTIQDYYPSKKIHKEYDVIVAMNVLAHVPNPIEFLIGIKNNLSEKGVAYIQTSQAMMLVNSEFDTIYHEHYSYFTIKSMQKACDIAGLILNEYELVDIHGTSIIFHITKSNIDSKKLNPVGFSLPNGNLPFTSESANTKDIYLNYKHNIKSHIITTKNIINESRLNGYKIVLAGTAAKSMTYFRVANIKIDHFIDEAEFKIGKFIPGASVPIGDFQSLDKDNNYLFVIGAWNFYDEIVNKLKQIYYSKNNRFLRYYPDIIVHE